MRQLHQSDPSDQERDAMANALASCREFDVVDPEIEQAEFLPYLVKNDETGLETKLQERLAEDPESPAGNYLMASLYWSRGQGNEAIALLEKASRNAPDDPRYSSTLAKIKKAPSKEKGHFQVSFSFQFLDI
jgi:Tfp pilus assembly protein PilF